MYGYGYSEAKTKGHPLALRTVRAQFSPRRASLVTAGGHTETTMEKTRVISKMLKGPVGVCIICPVCSVYHRRVMLSAHRDLNDS